MSIRKILAWGSVLAWMVLIFILSHQPAEVSSGMSSGIAVKIMEVIETSAPAAGIDAELLHTFVRKNAHFFAYLILGVLTFYALLISGTKELKGAVIALVIAVLYAISDETHQLFISGRSGEMRDVLIDSSGAAVGIGIYFLLKKARQLRTLSAHTTKVHQTYE